MGRGEGTQQALQAAPSRRGPGRRAPIALSSVEHAQLGSLRLKRNGEPSAHPYPSAEQWPEIRAHLVSRSCAANPLLDPRMTAYTPGETFGLLKQPEIQAWHEQAVAPIDPSYKAIVFVPCAKTKPWTGPAVKRSKLYSAYNQLREEFPEICFVTISEPLGVVPMQNWAEFPQYDNPGLFRDDAQRSGMATKQWEERFGQHYGLPLDEQARERCLDQLGEVVGNFLANNSDRKLIAVVDEESGAQTTHGEMLDRATAQTGAYVARNPKRVEARVSPLSYLRTLLASELEYEPEEHGDEED